MKLSFLGLVVASMAIVGCTQPTKNEKGVVLGGKFKELGKIDEKVGTGLEAAKGDRIYVTYQGRLLDGTVFDENTGGTPYMLKLGDGGVVQGWELGIPGMKEGGKRRLEIPSKLGYGEAGQGEKIKPNTDLIFDVTLHFVVKPGQEDGYVKTILKEGTGPAITDSSTVTMHYKASRVNDIVFDDTEQRDGGPKPVTFTLGKREVAPIFDKVTLVGVKQGTELEIISPPSLLFGQAGNKELPPGQPIKFHVKILNVK